MSDDVAKLDAAVLGQYRRLRGAVDASLDLEAGMADVTDVTRYTALRRSVAHCLDLDVGLGGALAMSAPLSAATAPDPGPRWAPPAIAGPGADVPRSRAPAAHREPADIPGELVTRAMAADRAAIAELISIIRPLVVRYCRARLGRFDRSSVSADDVAQEVCLAVLTALPGYRVQGRPFLAFVYGIASHKVIDAHRAATRNRSEPVPDLPDRVESADGPEQHALRAELSDEMNQLLDRLPDKQREILVLRVVVGLSAEETAEAVGSTPGAVRVAQHRALGRLRRVLPGGEPGLR